MNAHRFAVVERLYNEALLRPTDQRAAFLTRVCSNDEALRLEVASLLSLQTDADVFLSRSALEEAVRTNHELWETDSWPAIPGYTVQRVLGEGGMGVVYLAAQETPLRRLVALKLIKPGMDTRRVVARFETERQALALMDHPNIAAVFDAGSTSEGRPYFVMEFVEGVSITEYCDGGRLSTRDRLALFVQVCAAVQHAHQKGVIHRDLKPSNVLVAERNGHALPKVIDFGTAKAVGGAWNATGTQAGQGMVLGTLEYMSPEQAALSADIDTATDVYSLGVLLYELLVGRLPFDTADLRAAGYDEIRRVIRESDPPKPSVRVEQRSDKSGPAAHARQTDAAGLTRQLRGDLDWITLKALEKDRARRYATVAAFATDIERFLGDQPVEARPPSRAYRLRKFTRRHRLAVAAVAAIITILSAGVASTTALYWQAVELGREAERQKQQADEQREEAVAQRLTADRKAAEADEQRSRAEGAQAEAMNAVATANAALQESIYQTRVATLAAALGNLRIGAAAEARALLLTMPEAQRGWEWRHLFVQTDESTLSLSSANPPCGPALNLYVDGLRAPVGSCLALDRISGSYANLRHSVVNADGTVIAAATSDDALTTIRLSDFHQEVIRPGTGESTGQVTSLAISPDGLRLFTAEVGGLISKWTIGSTGTVPVSARTTFSINWLTVSPSGALLAFAYSHYIAVWDASTMERLAEIDVLGSPASLLFRDDDTLIVSTGASQDVPRSFVRIWNWRTRGLVAELEPRPRVAPQQAFFWRLALSSDRRKIALILPNPGKSSTVSIWDWDLKTEVGRLPPGDYWAVAFSPDGSRIVSVGTKEGVVRIWDWDGHQPRRLLTLADTDSHMGGVAFTSTGQIVVGRSKGGLTIWDTQIRR